MEFEIREQREFPELSAQGEGPQLDLIILGFYFRAGGCTFSPP